MNSTGNSCQWLLILLIANIVAMILHFTDNFIFLDSYPQPDGIKAEGVILYWIIMTVVGVVGYFLYRRLYYSSCLCLYAYSAMTIVSVGHYFYAPVWKLSLKMNAFLVEIFTALALAGFTFWLQLFPSFNQKKS